MCVYIYIYVPHVDITSNIYFVSKKYIFLMLEINIRKTHKNEQTTK